MKMPGTLRTKPSSTAYRRSLLLLLVLFSIGCLLGWAAHLGISKAGFSELASYLSDYAEAAKAAPQLTTGVASVIFVYFRYPLLFFLLSLFPRGKKLIAALCLVEGGFLAFSVTCFASALGRLGVLLALVAFGTRCLFVLPCSFFLAAHGRLPAVAAGKHRVSHTAMAKIPSDAVWRFAICVVVLAIGCFLELSVVPKLFSWALGRI
jgi:hypothetical protein